MPSLKREAGGEASAFPAFTVVDGDPASGPHLLVCDHADNRLPAEYGDLGLPASEFRRHIAYDPGSADLTRARGSARAPACSRRSRACSSIRTAARTIRRSSCASPMAPWFLPMRASARTGARRSHPALPCPLSRGDRRGGGARARQRRRAGALLDFLVLPRCGAAPHASGAGVLWDRNPRLAVPLIEALVPIRRWSSATMSPTPGRSSTTPCTATRRCAALPTR